MKVGLMMIFAAHKGMSDAEMYKNELKLAVEADSMGFDFITCVEHHFNDYSMSPDNAQTLSYLAAKTKNIKLMPAAFILPWNDPLRVVEKAVLLDILCDGRAMLGMGRGLAQREFIGFRQDLNEARERFDEAAEMVIRGLETGFVENNGKFYKQPRVEIRPRRLESFKGRTYMIGMSPGSVDVAGRLGLGCLKFSNMAWETAKPEVDMYNAAYKKSQGTEAPPIICADFVCVDSDNARAQEVARKHTRGYHTAVINHYEMKGEHFAKSKGYDSYAEASKELNSAHSEELIQAWADANLIGTPSMILEKLALRRELIGDFDITINISIESMPYEEVWRQTKQFVDEVMPVIKSWGTTVKGKATAAQ